jgi:hypothetical protein
VTAAPAALVGAALGLLPLLLSAAQATGSRTAAGVAVAVGCTTAALTGRLRLVSAAVTVVWLAASLATATGGPRVGVAVAAGVLLRAWCGLPELVAIGRPVLRDLGPDLAGGAAAAALVVAVADARADLPAPVALGAVVALGVLASVAVRRVRA